MEARHQNINMERLVRILSGEASSLELEQHREWLLTSEENRNTFSELQSVWQSMDKTSALNDIDIEAEWFKLKSEAGINSDTAFRKIILKPIFRIAASVLIVVGLSIAGWLDLSPNSISTGIAETREIILPDGSQVSLNASSGLQYNRNFGKDGRRVKLTGEAYFRITKNPNSPFIISVNENEIKVLGTEFNVRSYKDNGMVEVTVEEGIVSFYRKKEEDHKLILKKGDKAGYNRALQSFSKEVNMDRNFISWKTRLIIFDSDSLLNVVKTLENVYHRQIEIENPAMKSCTITTSFNNKDFPTVLKILENTLGITSEEKHGRIILKGRGC
jgi:ferric-dicitrate binding protein FerR (iron transport regulator)